MHTFPIRVYYEDTDFSGVVYHASYLRFLERGRTELLRSLGFNQSTLFENKVAFMVRSMSLEFLAPAKVDDMLNVETAMGEFRGATFMMAQRILRADTLLIEAKVRLAHVKNGRATRLSGDLLTTFTQN